MASKSWRLQLAALGLFVCLLGGAAGVVQSQPSAAERETARALMQEGDRLLASGDVRAALERFTAAHAIMHIPTTGLEVARARAKLGQLVEARGLALEVASSVPVAGEPPVFGPARSAAAALARELEPRIPSLRAEVSPASLDYALTIDGVTLPQQARALAYRTDPGAHVIEITASGYASQRRTLTLSERQATTVRITLTPGASAGPAPTPAPGTR